MHVIIRTAVHAVRIEYDRKLKMKNIESCLNEIKVLLYFSAGLAFPRDRSVLQVL